MRILKTTLAINGKGHIVTAKEAGKSPASRYFCHQCGCPLIIKSGNDCTAPWFEHDQQAFPQEKLWGCPYLDPQRKKEIRLKEAQQMVKTLPSMETVARWHCVMCGKHYSGEKYCVACHTGVYSVADQTSPD